MSSATDSRHRRAVKAAALFAALAVAAAACGDDGDTSSEASAAAEAAGGGGSADDAQDAAYPVTVESCGVDYTFDGPPDQVLVGWPRSIETLTALGVEDSVVGYTSGSLSTLPEGTDDIPEISPDFTPSREAVVAAEADLFVLNDITTVAGESGGVSLDDLETAGTDVFVLGDYCGHEDAAGDTTDIVLEDIRDLGAVFGVPEQAEDLVDEVEDRLAELPDGDGATTAFVQVFDGDLYALGGSTYAAVLDAVGLTNLFDDLDDSFAEISAEEVLTLEPEAVVVVYDDTSEDPDDSVDEISDLLAQSPAVTDGAVIPVPYSAMSAHGVGLVDVAEQVANGL